MQWKFLCIGFVWGTLVSVGNYGYLTFVVKKNESRPPRDKILSVVRCFIVRYFINMAALFCSYWFTREMWAIAGTGFGLTVMKNVIALLELRKTRECRLAGESEEKRRYYRSLLEYTDDEFYDEF